MNPDWLVGSVFGVLLLVSAVLFVAVTVTIVAVGVYRFKALRNSGFDPLAADVQMMAKARDSQLLAPPATDNSAAAANSLPDTPRPQEVSARLAEVDQLTRQGAISEHEARALRQRILDSI